MPDSARTPSPRAGALAERFALALDASPPPGLAGEKLARAGGSSTEFHDRRPYQVGDDVRRIDWRAFARSDQLVVRVQREERLARVEVLLDVSRSMDIEPGKAALAVELAALFGACARRDGSAARIVALRPRPQPIALDEFAAAGVALDERSEFEPCLRGALEIAPRGSVFVLISDFLFPHDARRLLAPLASRAGAFACVQVLSPSERTPPTGAAWRMADCESGSELNVVVDRAAAKRYSARLDALVGALREECRRARAPFVSLVAERPLEDLARGPLTSHGLLAPR